MDRPAGMEALTTLVLEPESVGKVPLEQVPGLLAKIAGLQAVLLARLISGSPNGPNPTSTPAEHDRFMTAEQVAPILGVTPRWLYRHARKLPFTRRLSRKALRFSEAGLRRYLASRRS